MRIINCLFLMIATVCVAFSILDIKYIDIPFVYGSLDGIIVGLIAIWFNTVPLIKGAEQIKL